MGQFFDMRGKKFGRLLILQEQNERDARGQVRWLCRCDCGTEHSASGDSLRRGGVRSCGCLQRDGATRHGRHGTPEYRCWSSMLSRCTNSNHNGFKDYGGRGITICERWRQFENFLADMGERPSAKHSIDRKDNDKGYSPENCRWATAIEQIRNRRRPRQKRVVHIRGMEFRTVADAAKHFGVTPGAVRHWINGQPPAQAKGDCYVRNVC